MTIKGEVGGVNSKLFLSIKGQTNFVCPLIDANRFTEMSLNSGTIVPVYILCIYRLILMTTRTFVRLVFLNERLRTQRHMKLIQG